MFALHSNEARYVAALLRPCLEVDHNRNFVIKPKGQLFFSSLLCDRRPIHNYYNSMSRQAAVPKVFKNETFLLSSLVGQSSLQGILQVMLNGMVRQ